MTYPHLPYAVTEAYCIIFAATVWFRLNNNLGSEHEMRQLRNMIYSYLAMLATDIIWALGEDELIHLPRLPYAFINAATVISIASGCYFWFKFIEDRLLLSFAANKTANRLLKLPLLLTCSLNLISVFTGWMFYIDEGGHYQSTSLFVLNTTVNYLYLLVPTVVSVYRAIKAHAKEERAECWTYALYMTAPLVAGALESVFPLVPLLALNIFLTILILFLMMQNMQIDNDALTGLNNRRRLNRYLEDSLPKASAEHPLFVFLMDINSFKSINDIYGHLEGDHALATFSAILKEVASKYSAFAARYGGDEFCMVTTAGTHTPEEIAADLHRSLKLAQEKHDAPPPQYTLTVSIGHTVCNEAKKHPDAVLACADEALYQNKNRWHGRC